MNSICHRHAIFIAITPGVTLLSKSSHACGRKSKIKVTYCFKICEENLLLGNTILFLKRLPVHELELA